MTLVEIYEQFTAGSPGFCNAVDAHCGFNMTPSEVRRIGEKTSSAAEFERIWADEDWWKDEKNR